jgi:hypothetical protein
MNNTAGGDQGEAARFVLEFGAFAGPTRFRSSFALVAGPGIESIGPTRSAYTWWWRKMLVFTRFSVLHAAFFFSGGEYRDFISLY